MTLPSKTLAARLFEYGGPDKLVVAEYDLPPLGPHDVLVKNLVDSVSRWDVKYRSSLLARYRIPGRASHTRPPVKSRPFPVPPRVQHTICSISNVARIGEHRRMCAETAIKLISLV